MGNTLQVAKRDLPSSALDSIEIVPLFLCLALHLDAIQFCMRYDMCRYSFQFIYSASMMCEYLLRTNHSNSVPFRFLDTNEWRILARQPCARYKIHKVYWSTSKILWNIKAENENSDETWAYEEDARGAVSITRFHEFKYKSKWIEWKKNIVFYVHLPVSSI